MSPKNPEGLDNAQLHDEQENISSNPSNNTPFREVLRERLNRREVLQGGLAAAATTFLAPEALAAGGGSWRPRRRRRGLVNFNPVSIAEGASDSRVPHISSDYEYQVLIPWGTPIEPGATRAYNGEPNRRPTSKEAALQIGIGHDGMWFFPEDERYRRMASITVTASATASGMLVH